MAEASTKEIKARIKSVQSTRQITKAMELVASSKLRHAKERVERTKPFFILLNEAIDSVRKNCSNIPSTLVTPNKIKKTCYIVIAGDRGLAGGYNANLFREVMKDIGEQDYCVLPIGRKSTEFFRQKNVELISEDYDIVDGVTVGDCYVMAKIIEKAFLSEKFDRVCVAYTQFVTILTQVPTIDEILPFYHEEPKQTAPKQLTIYEPSAEEILDEVVKQYIAGFLYSAVSEALASEFGARRTAMDAANKNAGEMIDDLTLKFNRARQAIITQEISEIVSGAEAL